MPETLLIINPHAGATRGLRLWQKHEPALRRILNDPIVALTDSLDDLARCIDQAAAQGVRRVISFGGDGTNHSLINALMHYNQRHPDDPLICGVIPAGTGRDWARGRGISLDIEEAAHAVMQAEPRLIDIGTVSIDGRTVYFLNISSAGIANDVVIRVERATRRRPWTFAQAIVGSLLHYHPERVHITVDGEDWYQGAIYVLTVANGTTFAQGVHVAPDALVDDGLFDLVLVEGMTRLRVMIALQRLFRGTHLSHPRVHHRRGTEVRLVRTDGAVIGMDLDGEGYSGREIIYRIEPKALWMLM